MGAGASAKNIYADAVEWFKKYFDTETYVQDFRSIDKDEDGGITDGELVRWIKYKKQTEGGAWGAMVENKDIFRIAHAQTVKEEQHVVSEKGSKTFSLASFRTFLLHLYSISILWTHFKYADEDIDSGDVGNYSLTKKEFELAVHTLTKARLREEITEEQMQKDFLLLDLNEDNGIAFTEVCEFCCRYISETKSASMQGQMPYDELNDVNSKHFTRLNSLHTNSAGKDPTNAAVEALKEDTSFEASKITYTKLQMDTDSHLRASFQAQTTPSDRIAIAHVHAQDYDGGVPPAQVSPYISPRGEGAASAPSSTDPAANESASMSGVLSGTVAEQPTTTMEQPMATDQQTPQGTELIETNQPAANK